MTSYTITKADKVAAQSLPNHLPIKIAENAVAKAHSGQITQSALNTVMVDLAQAMGLSMDAFLKTDAGRIFLRPCTTADHSTRIELAKRTPMQEDGGPWDKNAHDPDADELMKIAKAIQKLGHGRLSLDQALTMAM